MRARVLAAAVALGFGVAAGSARAQAGAGAVASAPDVVMLKDGGLLRGTIAELVPDKRVVIVLITGDKRTFSMKDVTYAGPAANAPGAATAPAPAPETPTPNSTGALPDTPGEPGEPAEEAPRKHHRHEKPTELEDALTGGGGDEPAPQARRRGPSLDAPAENSVRFESSESGLWVYVLEGTATAEIGWGGHLRVDAYRPLCQTPCSATLAPGSYQFALAHERGDKPAASEDLIEVRSGTTVHAEYESKAGLRAAGWILALGGTLGGTLLMLDSIHKEGPCISGTDPCIHESSSDSGELVGGLVLTAVGVGVGTVLIIQKDSSSFSLGAGPVAFGGARWKTGELGRSSLPIPAPGLGLSGTF
ncbi:MAG TPA: hypothetical protein VHE30_25005 [Polyangiaceae bacterium]|nr:hypothetical protein [Polyangiaceae bacterium]